MLVVNSEKNDKKEGADAFVAVVEGVVLNDKVEEVGGFFRNGGVKVVFVVALVDGGEAGVKGVTARFAEEVGTLNGVFQPCDNFVAELRGELLLLFSGFGVETGEINETVVVFLEGLPGSTVFTDDFEDAIGFAGIESLACDETTNDTHHTFDFVEFLGVEKIGRAHV